MFLIPASADAQLATHSDRNALLAALEANACASRHVESISLGLEWERFTAEVARSSPRPWEDLTPTDRRLAARTVIAGMPPSRRGGLETALAELLAQDPDTSAGLWIEEEPDDDDDDIEVVSSEESAERLRAYIEERAEARLQQGPSAGTALLLRWLVVPTAAITKARKLRDAADPDAAEAALLDQTVAEQQSQVIGEHEAVNQLLALVPASARAPHDFYTAAAARDLLAAIEGLQAKHGGEAKLGAALGASSVGLGTLKRFKGALRRAVEQKHGFAIVMSTTLM